MQADLIIIERSAIRLTSLETIDLSRLPLGAESRTARTYSMDALDQLLKVRFIYARFPYDLSSIAT
jgi:hypothetical protein